MQQGAFLCCCCNMDRRQCGILQEVLLCCGVQNEDEDLDMDFTAASLEDYLFNELQLVGCDFHAIEFISCDNTSCNPKFARLIGNLGGRPVPLIYSHNLNLAVLRYISSGYSGLWWTS